jgi:hypothetical protein
MIRDHRKLKFMPDYYSYCLWGIESPDNFSASELDIPCNLKESIRQWEEDYNKSIDMKNPGFSNIFFENGINEFVERGRSLCVELNKFYPDVLFKYFNIIEDCLEDV